MKVDYLRSLSVGDAVLTTTDGASGPHDSVVEAAHPAIPEGERPVRLLMARYANEDGNSERGDLTRLVHVIVPLAKKSSPEVIRWTS